MKESDYPVEPPRGIFHFPQGVFCLTKEEDTGKEEVKIKRISGDEFEFEITPKDLTEAEQKDFPIRVCEKEEWEKEELSEKGKQIKEILEPKDIIKSEKKVDLIRENKHRVVVKDGELIKIGNTIIYAAGTDTITITNEAACTFQAIYTAIGSPQVEKNDNFYVIDAKLRLVNSTLSDTKKAVRIHNSSPLGMDINSTLQLGELVDGIPQNGCLLHLSGSSASMTWYGHLKLYDTILDVQDVGIISLYCQCDWRKVVTTNLDVAVSSRNATTPPTTGEIDTELAGTHGSGSWEGSTASDVADAVDIKLSANHGTKSWRTGGGGSTYTPPCDSVWDKKELTKLYRKLKSMEESTQTSIGKLKYDALVDAIHKLFEATVKMKEEISDETSAITKLPDNTKHIRKILDIQKQIKLDFKDFASLLINSLDAKALEDFIEEKDNSEKEDERKGTGNTEV